MLVPFTSIAFSSCQPRLPAKLRLNGAQNHEPGRHGVALAQLKERVPAIVLLDGAYGTLLQERKLEEDDYRGELLRRPRHP